MARDSITFVKPHIWSAPEVTRVANARIRPTSGSPHDRTPPTVPTGLTAVAVSETQVDMTWGPSTDPAVPGYETSGMKGYRVFRNSRKIAEVSASVLSYSATGLTPSTPYQFRVAALDNRNNQSPQTPQITVTMPDAPGPAPDDPDTTAPSVPANLAAVAQGETQINLTWSAATDPTISGAETSGVANYKLYRDSAHLVTLGVVLAYSDTGLTPATEYSYTVSAMDGAGNESAQSAAEAATTTSPGLDPDVTAPSVPTSFAAAAQSHTAITLTWNASTDPTVGGAETSGLAGYKIRRGGTLIATLGLVTTYPDTGLTAATQYSYTISARDVAGNESAQSAAVLETTDAAPIYSLNVAWIPATQNDDGSPIGTILSHNIYASLTAGAPYEVTQNVPWTGTPSAVLILPSAGVWYVMVKTVTALGESIASEEESRAANVS